jgi:cell division protein FtsI/penicillin-binding protein 2
MMPLRALVRPREILIGAALMALAACAEAVPSPTPLPTTFPTRPVDAAATTADEFLAAWAASDFAAMHALLAPEDRARYTLEAFTALLASFSELTDATAITYTASSPELTALPPEPRSPEFPPPTPTPAPTVDPSASGQPAASESVEPSASAAPSVDPDQPLEGPIPGVAVEVDLRVTTGRFGELELDRAVTMTHGRDGWQVRWSPQALFTELGRSGTLRLERALGPRGRIVGTDGTVWAMTREDGVRVYPQEWLAGQTIGYVSEVTAEDLETLAGEGYLAGDVVGRSGLEAGAEDLLRGTPGWTLLAVAGDGTETALYETEVVPGASISITVRPDVQLAAHNGVAAYGQAATVAIDPASGDVWALASAPHFNPNAMTLGTTLGGQPLEPAGSAQVFNKAVLAAYPAGSSFKPFALAAALFTETVTPQSLVTCPPTWQYGDFTFRNYMNHTLPGLVNLAQAMAFSCNTTYMPLAYEVYQRDETALTDLLFEFGFGAPTGIGYVIEETGVVPDDEWLAANDRGGYTAFEQIQLAIGQGAFLGTPLQLANAYAAIGNGGTLWTPRIVTAATLPDGTVVEEVAPTVVREISVSDAHLAYITDTLVAVTTLSYGTGTAAFAGFGLPVAGKSGTAETGTPDPHAWFPAFAPAGQPTISVATVLPFIPLGTGGSDAAPLVRQVMAAHFN